MIGGGPGGGMPALPGGPGGARPGGRGGPGIDATGNPFADEKNRKTLETLQGRLEKPKAEPAKAQ
jgi:hypothetical protein